MKIHQKKARGFALLETLLMLGILVVVTVLSVYTIYSKVSESRHISQNSNEIISISSAAKNYSALDFNATSQAIKEGDLKAYGALDMFIDGKTSDNYNVTWESATSHHGVIFTIKDVSQNDQDRWEVIKDNVKKHSPSITAEFLTDSSGDIKFTVPVHQAQ